MKTVSVLISAELVIIGYILAAQIDFVGLAAFISAIGGAIAAVYAAKAAALAAAAKASSEDTGKHLADVKKEVGLVKDDIHKVEKATNSMKDALVSVTEKEALGRGKAEGIAEEKDRVQVNAAPLVPAATIAANTVATAENTVAMESVADALKKGGKP